MLQLRKYGFCRVQEMKSTREAIDKQAPGGGCKDGSVPCGEKVSRLLCVERTRLTQACPLRCRLAPDLHRATVQEGSGCPLLTELSAWHGFSHFTFTIAI